VQLGLLAERGVDRDEVFGLGREDDEWKGQVARQQVRESKRLTRSRCRGGPTGSPEQET
jgi:hypothetical protein